MAHEEIGNLLEEINRITNEPFLGYSVDQVYQEESKFILRRFKGVLFEVTGFGTDNSRFTKKFFVNSSMHFNAILGTSALELRESDMHPNEIGYFNQKIEDFLSEKKLTDQSVVKKPPSSR